MATWAELREQIRRELRDLGSKWSDDELLDYFNDALRDYSDYFPLETVTTVAVSGGAFPLPTGTIEVLAVESDGHFLEPLGRRPGTYRKQSSGWYVQGSNLYILPANDVPDEITLHTAHVHTLVSAVTPTPSGYLSESDPITVPDIDLELPKLFVMAKAVRRVQAQTANLDRFKIRGDRDDNPMVVMTNQYWNAYLEKLNRRLAGTRIQMWVPGRQR